MIILIEKNKQNTLKRKKLSEDTRKKISNTMKKAHKEGRAWNIGKSRWNNEASYPEKFFMKVIENNFDDKDYKREYPVNIYSIDFAWVNKKLAIEIDGCQHEKPQYKERDARKDKTLSENGWLVLRIKWKEVSIEPQKWINIANDFINNNYDRMLDINETYGTELDFKFLQQSLGIDFIENAAGRKIGINTKETNKKKKLIVNSNIDFSKQGWVRDVALILEITPQKVTSWMRRNMYEFWQENCFKRKGTKI